MYSFRDLYIWRNNKVMKSEKRYYQVFTQRKEKLATILVVRKMMILAS